jgi:hypothetical protein
MRVLEPEDHDRLNTLTRMLPRPVSVIVDKMLWLLIRPEPESGTSVNL